MPPVEFRSAAAFVLGQSLSVGLVALLLLVARRLAGHRIGPRWGRLLWLLVPLRWAWPGSGLSGLVSRHLPGAGDLPVPGWAFAAWAGVAGFLLLLGLGSMAWELWRVRAARPLGSWRAWKRLAAAKEDLGIRRPVPLFASHRVPSPRVVGWLRPRLVVPHGLLEVLSDDELRCVLRHELAHVRGHDVAWGMVAALVRAVFWFDPLVHLAAWRFRADCEEVCDATAVGRMGDGASVLASTLAKTALMGAGLVSSASAGEFEVCLPEPLQARVRTAGLAGGSPWWAAGCALAVVGLGF